MSNQFRDYLLLITRYPGRQLEIWRSFLNDAFVDSLPDDEFDQYMNDGYWMLEGYVVQKVAA